MRIKYSLLIIISLMYFVIAGCIQNANGDKSLKQVDWDDINAIVSDFIIKYNSKVHAKCDKAFEVHNTYGVEVEGDNTYVYTLVLYEQYDFEEEKFKKTCVTIEPTIFTLRKNRKNEYTVVNKSIPEGGEGYFGNIRNMFTEKYFSQVYQDLCSDNNGGLVNLMNKKVKEWLKVQGKGLKR